MDVRELYDIYKEHPVVTTDSRNVPVGSLFFALRGGSFDGNRFAADALAKGAAYVVVDDPAVGCDERYILVRDSLSALQELATWHRRQLAAPVIAITGTNGKTTTKELTAAVLSEKYKVHATQGNLNNHIGVPLTLLSMPTDAQVAIIEMGASALGEIAALCEIARPDYGVITNVGRAHLEGFGGEEGVRAAKGELYDYLAANGGTAIVRADDPVLTEMAAARKGLNVVLYNSSASEGMESGLAGAYNIYNIAAAAELGRIFGVAEQDIVRAVKNYTPVDNRSRLVVTERNVIIADCYNANPSSMAAALDNFIAARSPEGPDGRPMVKTAVLGDMLELGEWSAAEHEEVLRRAVQGDISEILLVGPEFSAAWVRMLKNIQSIHTRIYTFNNICELQEYFRGNPLSGSFILLKGSRGIALEQIIPLL